VPSLAGTGWRASFGLAEGQHLHRDDRHAVRRAALAQRRAGPKQRAVVAGIRQAVGRVRMAMLRAAEGARRRDGLLQTRDQRAGAEQPDRQQAEPGGAAAGRGTHQFGARRADKGCRMRIEGMSGSWRIGRTTAAEPSGRHARRGGRCA
jgi:hypothetical protein